MASHPATCPQCGAPVQAGVLGGLCAACVRRVALVSGGDGTQELTLLMDGNSVAHDTMLDSLEDYEILETIARGGMGVVYRARQRSLNREVALKMVLSGRFAGVEEVRRFRAEAEAAARLDHPNIVPIYEVGEHEGRPFFSMRLIEGRDLAEVLSTDAGKRMSARDSAVLMAKVARAVHYAHQRGLIHRDLKPANILIDAHGEPHITDFGLAKEIEDAEGLTLSGAVVGTPGYMAPEQAAGKVRELTTAVDVFALGAVLYHLLTSKQPFKGGNAMETLRLVLECDPKPPTACGARIDRDLETICLRCLEKAPGLRFGSAEALAEDLERWLRGETILARPSTMIERTVKWAKRRPAIASLGALAALFFMLGVAGVFWQWRRADAALALALTNEQRAKKSRDKAEEILEFMLGDLRTKLRTKATLGILRDVEAQVAGYYRDMEVSPDDAGQVLRQLRAIGAEGSNQDMAGDKVAAEERIRASLRGVAEVLRREPDNIQAKENLGMAHFGLGRLLDQRGDLTEAEAEYRKALGLMEELMVLPEGNLGWTRAAVSISDQLADILQLKGDLEGAGKLLKQAHARIDEILRLKPGHYDGRYKKGLLCRSSADLAKQLGDRQAALEWLRQAGSLNAALAAEEPDDVLVKFELAVDCTCLGDLLAEEGDVHGAQVQWERSFALTEALISHDPDYAIWQEAHASNCKRKALMNEQRGDHAAAERYHRKTLEIREKLAALDVTHLSAKRNLGLACVALGDFLLDTGRQQEAEGFYARALQIREELRTKEPGNREFQFDLSRVCERMAHLKRINGALDEAESLLRRAREITLALSMAAPDSLEWVRQSGLHARLLADVLKGKGAADEAMSHYDEAVAIMGRLIAAYPRDLETLHEKSVILDRLGDIAMDENDLVLARRHREECHRIHQELVRLAPKTLRWQRELSVSTLGLGDLDLAEGKIAAGDKHLRQGFEIREDLAKRSPGSATAQLGLAIACHKLASARTLAGDPAEAVSLSKRAVAIAAGLESAGQLSPSDMKWPASFRKALAYHEQKLQESSKKQ